MAETIRERARAEGMSLEELRRKNPSALAMDLLYLFVVAFFAYLATHGAWAAAIAAIPLVAVFVLGYRSSVAFLAIEIVVAIVTVAAATTGAV